MQSLGRLQRSLTAWLAASDVRFAEAFARVSMEQWVEFRGRWLQSSEAVKWARA